MHKILGGTFISWIFALLWVETEYTQGRPKLRTIKVDDFGYELIETARKLMEDMWPTPVTQGFIASAGVFMLLLTLGKMKSGLQSSPEGQVYLMLIKLLQGRR